jgi:uncharacterized damage-inducible protein DinB
MGNDERQAVVEPWLRGTLTRVDPVVRAVLHALELAREDAERWTGDFTEAEMYARPVGLPSVAFHLRHIVQSLDRLLTYAEGDQLDDTQLHALRSEMRDTSTSNDVREEFAAGLQTSANRVRGFAPAQFGEERGVGRRLLPSTVGGLLVHCADHTQRHSGQMVTTAKVILAGRGDV